MSKYVCNFEPLKGVSVGFCKAIKSYYVPLSKFSFSFPEEYLEEYIKLGVINKTQEPIWTDDDMIEFAQKYASDTITAGQVLKFFKKERGIE